MTYTEGVLEGTIIAMNGEDMFVESETQDFVALVTKEQADALTDASFDWGRFLCGISPNYFIIRID